MNTKQYTITEENDWEGETFGYIMDLTDDEVALITNGLAESEFHSIEPSNYTPEQAALVNKHDTNGYMPRLGFYAFKKSLVDMIAELDDWSWPGDFAEHYVRTHRVKPTDEFITFVKSKI